MGYTASRPGRKTRSACARSCPLPARGGVPSIQVDRVEAVAGACLQRVISPAAQIFLTPAVASCDAYFFGTYNGFGFKNGQLEPFKATGAYLMVNAGPIKLTQEGKLADDLYLPFFVPDGGESISLCWAISVYSSNNGLFDGYEPETEAKTLMPGMVYEAQASTFPSMEITYWLEGEDY